MILFQEDFEDEKFTTQCFIVGGKKSSFNMWYFLLWCSPAWCLFQLLDHISGSRFTGTCSIHITRAEIIKKLSLIHYLVTLSSLPVSFQAQQNWQAVFTFSSSLLFMQDNRVWVGGYSQQNAVLRCGNVFHPQIFHSHYIEFI